MSSPLRIITVPCLQDNYAYLVVDPTTKDAAVVDPSEAAPVKRALEQDGLTLAEIWITHHHWDHVGGIGDLLEHCKGPVRGSVFDQKNQRIEAQSEAHSDGDTFSFHDHDVRILEIPGHTLGAIAYITDGNVFTGDTLFLAGCGRLFEGTPAMMADSIRKLRALPADSEIYCGHEYTVNNLKFAKTVEPDNSEIAKELQRAEQKRSAGEPTVPWTLERDAAVNPFMRFDLPHIQESRTPEESFGALREAKDKF